MRLIFVNVALLPTFASPPCLVPCLDSRHLLKTSLVFVMKHEKKNKAPIRSKLITQMIPNDQCAILTCTKSYLCVYNVGKTIINHPPNHHKIE